MKLKKYILLILASVIVTVANAIPARPGRFLWTLDDGSQIWLTLHGDEFEHYYMTDDGQRLVPDENGRLVPIAQGPRRAPMRRATTIDGMLTNYPTIGSPNALVLLVEYQDVRFSTQNAQYEFNRLMNEPGYDYNGATGSALDYFRDNSRGLFNPNFTICGPITLPNSMAYYGAATANAHDACPWEMVADGCRLLKEQNPDLDFSQFDNDGDGVIDNVFVFYAGYGQNSGASTNTVWPHAANITWYGLNVVIDGVKVDNYACTSELSGNETSGGERCGIGTFCHEFSHVLGLPDLYSTNYSSAFTPGAYELMDVGPYNNNGNTPPYMSVYDRMTLRWISPREITAPENLSLRAMDGTNADAFIIKTITDNEYFLLENRQQEGWDKFIPGHGMLVWHIDYDETAWSQNAMNNNPTHQRVDIIEADGLKTEESRSGDPFPGRTGVAELTDYSNPSMVTWIGTLVGCPLTDISEIDGIVTFKAKGGGAGIPVPVAVAAEHVTPMSFRALWTGDVSITTYQIDICKGAEVVPFATFTKTITSLADCYIDIEDLEPDTRYSYSVKATSGSATSANSNTIYVTTLPPTFDMLQPTALAATDVCADSFTANWQAMAGAEAYLIDVYTKEYVEPVYDTIDFTGGITSIPEGWSTSSASTSAAVGTFGAARPSLLFKQDQDFISSPLYDIDLNSLTFWYKGNNAVAGSLEVQAMVGAVWTNIAELTLSKTADTFSCDLPTGTRRIRLVANLQAGSLYIDDITIAYNGAAQCNYVEGYNKRRVEGNACIVSGLSASTEYFYSVTGVSASICSQTSSEVTVTTLLPDGITAAAIGQTISPRKVIDNNGLRIIMPSGEQTDLSGVKRGN